VRKRRIRGFSRGMRQRLGLAQAMINRPQVLFLDEPASALDPVGRKDILELISNLRGECTVFMSTHILADVERICDTIGIINHGKLIKEARQDDLLAQYTIPAFEIEVENGLEGKLETWIASLRSKSWVQSVSAEGHHARIIVRSIQQAQQELLPNLLQAGLILRKYEIVTPSLEDIFIRLTNTEEGKVP
jgi:ABC-2 type transport system ATP-binding protein